MVISLVEMGNRAGERTEPPVSFGCEVNIIPLSLAGQPRKIGVAGKTVAARLT
jgi:hypothetical protein